MRGKPIVLGLAAALLCAACTAVPGKAPAEGELALWFPSVENGERGNALKREYRDLTPGEETAESLLSTLLAGPESPELQTPFPNGTALRSCRMEEGTALVDLSEAYGGLSGAELSLADGCIVLTLCQLPQVERVYLTVEGRPRPFRDLVLSGDDFLLDNGAGGESQMELRLWFPAEAGLAAEERTLSLRVGDRPEIAALQALLEGPESGELRPVCPEGTTLLSLTREEGRYVVNVSGGWLEEGETSLRFQALEATLRELDSTARVEVLVEGEPWE